jgi:hypothetical protein
MLSSHPNSAGRRREQPRFTVFVELSNMRARAGSVRGGKPGEVEVKRHRRPAGLGNWRLVSEAADRMNEVARRGAA